MNVSPFSPKLNRALSGTFLFRALSSELVMLRYALFSWRLRPGYNSDQLIYSMHRKTGFAGLVVAVLFVCLLEGTLVHLLVMRYSPTLATGLTLLTLYTMLFLMAHMNAVMHRPLLIDRQQIILRVGMLWHARIALANIRNVTLYQPFEPDKQTLNLAKPLLTAPNVLLELHTPILVEGMYGFQRMVKRLALYVDEPNLLRFGLSDTFSDLGFGIADHTTAR
ncbi:hypothetical protein [Nibrella viscosa]